MEAETWTQEQIRAAGMKALVNELGPAGAIRFLQLSHTGGGDYSGDRHRWLDRTGSGRCPGAPEGIAGQRGNAGLREWSGTASGAKQAQATRRGPVGAPGVLVYERLPLMESRL